MSDTQLQVAQFDAPAPQPFNAFGSVEMFKDVQRMGLMLCHSTMVPEIYRGEANMGNCVIALEMANRIGASVLSVMQNLYIVHGKPAWSSQFLISCVNASRKFSPLRYRMTGEKGKDSYGCVAWATDRAGERLESPEVNIAMAHAEGWATKNGSKWKTMPELMLRYRCATLFARLYAPELTMGIQTDDEVIDIAPIVTDPVQRAKPMLAAPTFAAAGVPPISAAVTPTVAKTKKTGASPPETAPAAATDEKAEADAGLAPQSAATMTPQRALEVFMEDAGVTFDKFRRWVQETERLDDADSVASWSELPTAFCEALRSDTKSISRCVARCASY